VSGGGERGGGVSALRDREVSPPAGGGGDGEVPLPGAGDFFAAEKVTKKPLETKVSRLPFFAGHFMKAKQVFSSFVTLFSTAVLTLQCAACPAARHFVVRDACHGRFCEESSALRRGLLFARTKSNQKFAKTYGFGIPYLRKVS